MVFGDIFRRNNEGVRPETRRSVMKYRLATPPVVDSKPIENYTEGGMLGSEAYARFQENLLLQLLGDDIGDIAGSNILNAGPGHGPHPAALIRLGADPKKLTLVEADESAGSSLRENMNEIPADQIKIYPQNGTRPFGIEQFLIENRSDQFDVVMATTADPSVVMLLVAQMGERRGKSKSVLANAHTGYFSIYGEKSATEQIMHEIRTKYPFLSARLSRYRYQPSLDSSGNIIGPINVEDGHDILVVRKW
jgi:hypothetical protein